MRRTISGSAWLNAASPSARAWERAGMSVKPLRQPDHDDAPVGTTNALDVVDLEGHDVVGRCVREFPVVRGDQDVTGSVAVEDVDNGAYERQGASRGDHAPNSSLAQQSQTLGPRQRPVHAERVHRYLLPL